MNFQDFTVKLKSSAIVPGDNRDRFSKFSLFFCIVPLLILFTWAVYRSLGWRIEHDTPIMFYMGFIMDEFGEIPYRDFFDMNMPGSYWIYSGVGHFLGFNDSSYRTADFIFLFGTMLSAALWYRKIGWQGGVFSSLFFALFYLGMGPAMSFQREYLALLPISLGVASALSFPNFAYYTRAIFVSFFFACAATIKPHLLIGFPVVFFYLLCEEDYFIRDKVLLMKRMGVMLLVCAVGAAPPVAAVCGYLLYHGVFGAFLDNAIHYLPLYGAMTQGHNLLSQEKYHAYWMARMLSLNGYGLELLAGLLAVSMALFFGGYAKVAQKQAATVGGLLLAYTFYPGISGQFWPYHYLPMVFFFCMAMGFAFANWNTPNKIMLRGAIIALIALVFVQSFRPEDGFPKFHKPLINRPKEGRVDAIANFLRRNLKEGDTVQALDWVRCGVAHAMLEARAKNATSFIYDFHFYHHVSTPYIQSLRAKFLREFTEAKPRFVVESLMNRPYFSGIDAGNEFEEFYGYLESNYKKRINRPNYVIWERHIKKRPKK